MKWAWYQTYFTFCVFIHITHIHAHTYKHVQNLHIRKYYTNFFLMTSHILHMHNDSQDRQELGVAINGDGGGDIRRSKIRYWIRNVQLPIDRFLSLNLVFILK